jgi:hypothetical protein
MIEAVRNIEKLKGESELTCNGCLCQKFICYCSSYNMIHSGSDTFECTIGWKLEAAARHKSQRIIQLTFQ